MEQQNSDGLSSHLWNQFSLYRFFGHQPNRPTGAALGRVGAHHGDDPLFLVVVQYFGGAGSLLLMESALQSGLLVAVAESTNGLWGERNRLGDLGSTDVLSQLQQRQGAQDHADLLNAAFQKPT